MSRDQKEVKSGGKHSGGRKSKCKGLRINIDICLLRKKNKEINVAREDCVRRRLLGEDEFRVG